MNKKIVIILAVLTLFGGFLRFYNNYKNPISLNIDEVSYGYSAYSILKTAHDENGEFLPLFFRSTGDYKNPFLIYSLVPAIALFGLNEFSVRFTTALFGTLSIPIFFFLLKSLTKDRRVILIGSILFTISPWHIYYSRFASEALIGLFSLMLGMIFFIKISKEKKIYAFLSAVFLALSMYIYHSERLFVFLFLIIFFILNFRKIKRLETILFILTLSIVLVPLIFYSIFGTANARAGMVFLSQDIEYTRYVILDHLQRRGESLLLLLFWIKRYLNYFQPDFLFFNGLNMTRSGTLGVGVFYLFEFLWLLLGIAEIIRKQLVNRIFIILWILIGIIPASLTNNDQSTNRTLLILPPIIFIVSLGAVKFLEIVKNVKNSSFKYGIVVLYSVFIVVVLLRAFLIFAIHFPSQRGEAFMEGTKETVLYANNNKDYYNEIVYDPYRGIEAPYIVNIPYMYILFYSKYDPLTYQRDDKKYGQERFSFNKYTIRRINWREDRSKKGVLFIGSPWSLPLNDLQPDEILKKIYLSNGDLALLIVSPK
ncbi:phospholipid carrier-dependent glycosyltransferase [Candidatus Daviesbacteria bacterium]|nr:phospholipid carrier-dependent glycosyltransferase [Candidatus Daviesbacteria bacterium]